MENNSSNSDFLELLGYLIFRFSHQSCGNDIWTYNPLYYLYDLCTCSDLDQESKLVQKNIKETISTGSVEFWALLL